MERPTLCQGCGVTFSADRWGRKFCSMRCMTARGPWAHPNHQHTPQPPSQTYQQRQQVSA